MTTARLDEIVDKRRIFATRFWKFVPDSWAAIAFPHELAIDEWISPCPDGDFVLSAGGSDDRGIVMEHLLGDELLHAEDAPKQRAPHAVS